MITSKSPRKVAMVARAAGKEAFSDYSHKFSPKKFTRPQLFACLVLKEFEKKDYRGVCALLNDCSDLRQAIELSCVPHFTTLQKASRRLLKQRHVRRLIVDTARRIRGRSRVPYAAVDSSGFDVHHAGRYFVVRTAVNKKGKEPGKRLSYKRYGKLMLIVCCLTHAILAAVASAGPTPDIDQLDSVVAELPDYAYDSGIDTTISRISAIADDGGTDAGTVVSYTYLGLSTIVIEAEPQAGVELTYKQVSGDTQSITDGGDQYTEERKRLTTAALDTRRVQLQEPHIIHHRDH
jgi:hypothetical protein